MDGNLGNDVKQAQASGVQSPGPGKPKQEKPEKASKASKPFMRRRARRACIACHERKVRCDVLQRQPCTNCEQDRCKCVVRPHKNRRASVAAMELVNQPDHDDFAHDDYEASPSDSMPTLSGHSDPQGLQNGGSSEFMQMRQQILPQPGYYSNTPFLHDGMHMRPGMNPWFDQSGMTLPQHMDIDPFQDYNNMMFNFDPLLNDDTSALTGIESVFNTTPSFTSPAQNVFNQPSPETSIPAAPTNEVLQSPTNLDFLDLTKSPVVKRRFGDSGTINPDREYLRSQGCFQLPSVPVFYALMRSYFALIHPNLPIINEAEFWSLWSTDGESFHVGTFSVLVLQAMAFAATSFAPPEVVAQCGFGSSPRSALKIFQKRAKLLFDMEMEQDPMCMSQAALLLTYYAASSNKLRVNSLWLTHAIRFAQIAGADRFHEVANTDVKRYTALKRLWWGCLSRDRILPLGMRRPIQIKETVPIAGDDKYLSEADFADELGHSRVHDAAAQTRIFHVINLACRLADALTPAMTTLFTAEKPKDRTMSTSANIRTLLADVMNHIEQLHAWHDVAVGIFPPPVALDDEPNAVTIYANLLFLYYNAAILALCHHAYLLWETRQPKTSSKPVYFEPPVGLIFNAVADTTERTKELLQLRLAHHLPISVSAYLCLPLLLHALSVKAATSDSAFSVAHRQLSIYTKVMSMQQKLYDGTDYVFEMIDNIQRYAEEERMGLVLDQEGNDKTGKTGGSTTPTSTSASIQQTKPMRQPYAWRALLLRKPRLYLRLVLHVDVAFCEGTAPQEHDFPPELRRS